MVCIAAMMVLPECIYWDRDIVICFKEVLKDVNETCVLMLYVKDAGVSKSLENLWINTNLIYIYVYIYICNIYIIYIYNIYIYI